MRRCKSLIRSMTVSTIVSGIIVWYIKYNCIESDTMEMISNIFIGIMGSAFVTLISSFFEFFHEKRQRKQDLIELYREVRVKIIPIIENVDSYAICEKMHEKIIYRMRDMLSDYKKMLNAYKRISNMKILQLYDIDIWNFQKLFKFFSMIYIMAEIHDYYSCMNSSIYIRNLYLEHYVKSYRDYKAVGIPVSQIKKDLEPIEKAFKTYKNIEKEMREKFRSIRIKEKCKDVDKSMGIFILK